MHYHPPRTHRLAARARVAAERDDGGHKPRADEERQPVGAVRDPWTRPDEGEAALK
jgi:hypothetical protein